MIENLGSALRQLQQTIAQNVDTPIVLPQESLELQFHGLSLNQLVVLADAAVLATVGHLRLADGTRVERFMIDGKDNQQRGLLARRLILDANASIDEGHVREVLEFDNGALRRTLVRDHDNVVYQLRDGQAAIDQELTDVLQRQRRPVSSGTRPPALAAQRRPVVISDPIGFYGTAGEILHGLAALQSHNRTAQQVFHSLCEATGERDRAAAVAAAGPDLLVDAFARILSTGQQIDTLVEALSQRMTVLLRLVERAEGSAPLQPRDAGAITGNDIDPPL